MGPYLSVMYLCSQQSERVLIAGSISARCSDFKISANKAACGGGAARSRLRWVRICRHCLCAFVKACEFRLLAPSSFSNPISYFPRIRPSCGAAMAHGRLDGSAHLGHALEQSVKRASFDCWLHRRSLTRFRIFRANKALVWGRCAWWAVALGPYLSVMLLCSQQSEQVFIGCSFGVRCSDFEFSANTAGFGACVAGGRMRWVRICRSCSWAVSKANE